MPQLLVLRQLGEVALNQRGRHVGQFFRLPFGLLVFVDQERSHT
jgi:hypothetical protein